MATSPAYVKARAEGDVLSLWNLLKVASTGTGSALIYSSITKLVSMRQRDQDTSSFVLEFTNTVEDLKRLEPDEKVLLENIFNTLFIISLDQTKFEKKLTPIYATDQWPKYTVFAQEIVTYERNISSIEEWQKNPDAPTVANVAKGSKNFGQKCFNCGEIGHKSIDCERKQATCDVCGRSHHTSVHDDVVRLAENKQKIGQDGKKSQGRFKGKRDVKKSSQKKTYSRKDNTKAMLNDEFEEDDDNDDDCDEDDDNVDDDNEQYWVQVNDDCEVYKVSNTKDESLDDTDFILDSGCKNSHICNDSRLLTQLSERPSATVQGISGPKVKPSYVGNLPFAFFFISPTLIYICN